jgi:glycosyltransferase-like protein LARGE
MLQAFAFLLLLLRITNGWYLAQPVHSVAEAECDQAPDALSQPFEYRTIYQYQTFGREGSKMEPCVLITQLSVERLHRLEVQARAWGGPISAAIYVPTRNGTSSMVDKIRQFSERMSNDSTYAGWMSLSILFGHEDSPWRYKCSNSTSRVLLYPINALRNLAVTASSGSKGSSFPLFFLLDVDFTPSKGLRGWIQAETKIGLVKRCKRGDMIVVPAFETNTTDAGPTIEWALQGYNEKTVVPFHSDHFRHGHGSTNYDMLVNLGSVLACQCSPVFFFAYGCTIPL